MGLVIKSSCFCKTSRIVVAEVWPAKEDFQVLHDMHVIVNPWTLQLHHIKNILKYILQISLGWGWVGKLYRRVILTWKIHILLTILWSSCLSFFCYCGSSRIAFVCFFSIVSSITLVLYFVSTASDNLALRTKMWPVLQLLITWLNWW